MFTSTLAAMAHHILAFLLIGILAAEMALVRSGMTIADRNRLGQIDLAYGLVALFVLIIGLLRAYQFEKGLDFYLSSTWFWVKLGAFLTAGLLSIPPTLRFRAWGKLGDALPSQVDIQAVQRWIYAEFALLVLVPTSAALMARGY
jgi:putative membrane protein